nr:MAG TPA: hypothetical protein [Caudoviricetes sp.]
MSAVTFLALVAGLGEVATPTREYRFRATYIAS